MISEELFDKKTFNSYGYEVKIYYMKDDDLKDSISIEPLDPYHPDIIYQKGQEPIISLQGMINIDDIEKVKKGLDDAKKIAALLNHMFESV